MDTDGNIWSLSDSFRQRFFLAATGGDTASSRGMIALTLFFLIFVICGAYFGAAESGFSAMNKIRIKAKAEDGDKRAKNAMLISNNFERALTTLLIGNNISHIAAASVATLIATRLFGSSDTVTVLCTVITTMIVFLFSEMIPKSFANDRSETTALFSAGVLKFLMKLFYPLAAFFSMISSAFTKLVERFFKKAEEPSITEEELYDIIDTIEEEGVINEEQGDLFKSALDFSGTHAQDVMTMRDDICAIDVSLSNEEILTAVRASTHTRLPVYEHDLDHIIGTLQIRTYIREYLKDPDVDLRSLLLPTFHVRPTAMIDDLLSEMRQHRFYLAVVSDEERKTLGLVTIEDFLEELVGEIWDEEDVVDKNFIKLGGNRFRVNTHMTLGTLCERIGVLCPDGTDPGAPLISLVLEHYGKMPEEDDTFLFHSFEVTVESVENNRIPTVIVRLLSDEQLESLAAEAAETAGEEAER